MAWRRLGDKPLSEPMMVKLLTHICVTRPQWVKWYNINFWDKGHFFLHKLQQYELMINILSSNHKTGVKNRIHYIHISIFNQPCLDWYYLTGNLRSLVYTHVDQNMLYITTFGKVMACNQLYLLLYVREVLPLDICFAVPVLPMELPQLNTQEKMKKQIQRHSITDECRQGHLRYLHVFC